MKKRIFSLALAFVLVLALVPAATAAANPYGNTSTFTYTDESGLFRIEIPGYIGTISEAQLPKVPGSYADDDDNIVYVDSELPYHVLIVEDIRNAEGQIYPTNASHISIRIYNRQDTGPLAEEPFSTFQESRSMGYLNNSYRNSIELKRIDTLTTNDPSPFEEAYSWEFSSPSSGNKLDTLRTYEKNAEGNIDWNDYKEVEVDVMISRDYKLNLIILTPDMADKFLETNVITLTVWFWPEDWSGETQQRSTEVDVEVPGLRELILAAKGEAVAPNPLDTASGWAKDAITSAVAKGFVPVDLQDKYTAVITRQEFCRMAVKWLEYKAGKSIDAVLTEKGLSRNPNAFSDTTDPDILAAYALGITSGTKAPTATTSGTFTPNGDFNREQAATMIRNTCKAAGMDVSNTAAAGFVDIGTASSWAADSINFCRNNGIMNGTITTPLTFSPKDTYTREQSIQTFNNIK